MNRRRRRTAPPSYRPRGTSWSSASLPGALPGMVDELSAPTCFVVLDALHLRGRTGGLELGFEPGLHDALCQLGTHDPRAHGEHLRIVALPRALRRVGVVRLSGPHAGDLVGADRHADASATHQDGALEAPGRHLLRNRERDVGVEHRSIIEGAEVLDLVVEVQQVLPDELFQLVARLVTTDRDLHAFSPWSFCKRDLLVRPWRSGRLERLLERAGGGLQE